MRSLINDDAVFTIEERTLGIRNPELDVVYSLRLVSKDTVTALKKKYTHPRPGPQGLEQITDLDAFADALLDHVVVGWQGITNGTGDPAPCDVGHKRKLPLVVQTAILDWAQQGVTTEEAAKAASFRGAPSVRGLVGG
jgi:hypothetical protein